MLPMHNIKMATDLFTIIDNEGGGKSIPLISEPACEKCKSQVYKWMGGILLEGVCK